MRNLISFATPVLLAVCCFSVPVALVAGGPVRFTENKGQVCDQFHQPRPDVRYTGHAGPLDFFLRDGGISYQLYNAQSIHRIDLEWIGANPRPVISPALALAGTEHFYLPVCPDGVHGVRTFQALVYEEVYPGVEMRWYSLDDHLKYDYYVAPGADHRQIRLRIEGATSLGLTAEGNLRIQTPFGVVEDDAPYVTQVGRPLQASWVLQENILSIHIPTYNPALPLVIDPAVRAWGTYYGGEGMDEAHSCVTDAWGNVYMAGITESTTLIATTGSHQTTFGGGTDADAFLAKIDKNGNRLWATYYGGADIEIGYDCATDPSGNVYLAGRTEHATGTVIATPGSHQPALGGNHDAFLVKFDSTGQRIWGTYFGGTEDEYAYACVTDPTGNVYIGGTTRSTSGIATPGSHSALYGGGLLDSYLAKFSPAGTLLWATYYGGTGNEWIKDCKTDQAGNIYLVGHCSSNATNGIATSGAYQTSIAGYDEAYVAKFDGGGTRLWGTYYGGTLIDLGVGCAVDPFGNVYVTGRTESLNGDSTIATPGSFQTLRSGPSDAFLLKLSPQGQRLWATYYGDSNNDWGYATVTDTAGNVFLAGNTNVGTGPSLATPNGYQLTATSILEEVYLAKFDPQGNRIVATYYGGAKSEYPRACAIGSDGGLFLVGYTTSDTGTAIASPGAHQTTFGGGFNDAFLVKFACPGNTSSLIDTTTCTAFTGPSGQVWTVSGTYADTIPNVAGCDSLITVNLTILPLNLSVTQSGPTLTAVDPNATYQWIDCNNLSPIPGATTQSFTPTANGLYAVVVTSIHGGCSDTSACFSMNPIAIVPGLAMPLQVYPNPTTGQLILQLPVIASRLTVEVFNPMGQRIQNVCFADTAKPAFELQGPDGLYVLHVTTPERTYVAKVVKE